MTNSHESAFRQGRSLSPVISKRGWLAVAGLVLTGGALGYFGNRLEEDNSPQEEQPRSGTLPTGSLTVVLGHEGINTIYGEAQAHCEGDIDAVVAEIMTLNNITESQLGQLPTGMVIQLPSDACNLDD